MDTTIKMHVHQGCLLLFIADMGVISFTPDQVESLIQFWLHRPKEDTVVTVRDLLEEPPSN